MFLPTYACMQAGREHPPVRHYISAVFRGVFLLHVSQSFTEISLELLNAFSKCYSSLSNFLLIL